jgi:hypothetical protein
MPKLALHLLGSFRITVDGEPRDGFRSDKARALLAYLALEGVHPLRRSQLLKLLWLTYPRLSAQASLRMALASLRQVLAPLELVATTRQTVQLQSQSPTFWCDVLELEALLATPPTPQTLAAIEALYQGPFLAGFENVDSALFHAWAQTRRDQYEKQVNQLRTQLAVTPPLLAIANGGNVPQSAHFYGRQLELKRLARWLTVERCRLIGIFGMGGQGKTTLASQVARSLTGAHASEHPAGEEAFELGEPFVHVIWRSLLNAPSLTQLLQSCIQLLAGQAVTRLPANLDEQLALLLTYLRQQRCLLVFDNLESILESDTQAGRYRPGYEAYAQLLYQIGEGDHQSCLLLTSREKPLEFTQLEASTLAVRALALGGLTPDSGRQMLRAQTLVAPDAVMDTLIRHYSGNPLALTLVAETIKELFAGNIAAFLTDKTLVFDDIRDVLD